MAKDGSKPTKYLGIKRFITAVIVMAVVILALTGCGIKKEAPTTTTEAPTVTEASIETEAPTEEPTEEQEPVLPLPNTPKMVFEAIEPEQVTGKVYSGHPIDVHSIPINVAVCRNLTSEGMEMDAQLNIAYVWEEIKNIQPGDAIEVDGKLLPITSVFGEELTGTPDLIAVNGGDFYIQNNPSGLGWGTNEGEALLLYDQYFPATMLVKVQVEFPDAASMDVTSEWNEIVPFEEFLREFSDIEFRAVVVYGTQLFSIIAPTPMSRVEEMGYYQW